MKKSITIKQSLANVVIALLDQSKSEMVDAITNVMDIISKSDGNQRISFSDEINISSHNAINGLYYHQDNDVEVVNENGIPLVLLDLSVSELKSICDALLHGEYISYNNE